MKTIIFIGVLLSVIYLYALYTVSPEWSALYGFSDAMYLIKNQLVYLLISIVILILLIRTKSSQTFDRVGLSLFGFSLVLLVAMFFLPNSIVPFVDGKRLYLVVGIFIYPMLFFTLGVIWFINSLHNKFTLKNLNATIFALMLLSGFLTLSFHDYGMFLLLELLMLFFLFYLNGVNKYLLGALVGLLGAIGIFIITSAHRLSRLQNWIASLDLSNLQNSLDLVGLQILNNNFGMIFVIGVIAFFVFFIYSIHKNIISSKNNELFKVGIMAIFVLTLILNCLALFGLLPIEAPPLYFFDYGFSISVISYLMLAMLGV